MSVANKLFDRSHGFIGDVNATNPNDLPALYVDGELPSIPTEEPYEGRLQIHNAIGACSVELLSGNLPPGSTVVVDNTTHEVVVRWPSFGAGTVDIPNGSFEKGDDGSWEIGAGFTIESTGTVPDPNDPGSTHQLQFANLHADPDGPDTMSTLYFPLADARANGQTSITASADVQQGASSENQAGAAVRILFYDNVGLQVGGMDGNVIKSGSNSNWQTSTVNAPIPALASYARVGAVAYRKGQNRALWIDNIKWNLSQASQGTSVTGTVVLSLRVTDSLGRTADWSGIIRVINAFGARMWRLWATANCDTGSGAYLNLALIALQETAGGPNLCVGSGGTATQSTELSATAGVVNAFENPNLDGTGNPNGRYWHSDDQSPYTINAYGGKSPTNPWWAAYDFGAGKTKFVSQITLVPTNAEGRWPVDFLVQTSDDGSTWTTVMTVVNFQNGNSAQWGLGTTRSITLPTPV